MPINASYEYLNAEKEYLNAQSMSDRIYWLEEMIKKAPKHKSSENFLSELKKRLKKLREKDEVAKKKSGGKKGIRKEGFQFALVGKTNSGKSLLLGKLTNASSESAEYKFTTRKPEIGTFEFEGAKAQIVDLPSIGGENFDVGIANNADCLLIVVESLDEIQESEQFLSRAGGKRIIILNKCDKFDGGEFRKAGAKMRSRKINGVLVSALTGEGILELKEKMFSFMGVIRVYMKEPGKSASGIPAVLKIGATVKDVAENIRKGFSLSVRETRLTGPSGKFPNQKIGLKHKLRDKDVVEFHTR